MICEFNKLSERPYFFVDPVRGNQIGRMVLGGDDYPITRNIIESENLTPRTKVLFQITMDAPAPPCWVEYGALRAYPESPIEEPAK